MDATIFESENFTVKVPSAPHVPRRDGGHIYVEANDNTIEERVQLTPKQAVELAWLVSLAGQAYWDVMPQRGLDLYRLNYQDNGNWAFVRGERPVLHIHIYGRTRDEKHQSYGQALHLPYIDTGFYDGFEPLSNGDIQALRARMSELTGEKRFCDWSEDIRL